MSDDMDEWFGQLHSIMQRDALDEDESSRPRIADSPTKESERSPRRHT